MTHSKGISWFDDCRIPFVDDIDLEQKQNQKINGDKYGGGKGFHKEPIVMQMYKPQGRFPANLLVCDDMLNDGVVSISQGGNVGVLNNKVYGKFKGTKNNNGSGFGDKGSNSRYYNIDKWFDKIINYE